MADRFRQLQEDKATTKDGSVLVKDGGRGIEVKTVLKNPCVKDISLDLDESYDLTIGRAGDMVSPHLANFP